MKLTNYAEPAQFDSVHHAPEAFGFVMNAKMYDILTSKLYSDKPGAIIRELCSNALDSHVMAGKADVPFDLQVPNWLDGTFRLRDYGTGIPHDDFSAIYNSLGASTKENSNEQLGAYGLGSKTPFTLTETYVIKNWCNGELSTWTCFKDAGLPMTLKVSQVKSDEPSGLEVSFTLSTNSTHDFIRSLPKQLRFFKVKPNITGADIDWDVIPDSLEDDGYALVRNIHSTVVVGCIGFPLDTTMVDYGSSYYNYVNAGVILKMDIGDVDIPPNRESLEMTEKTKAALKEKLNVVDKVFKEDFRARLLTITSRRELSYVLRSPASKFMKYTAESNVAVHPDIAQTSIPAHKGLNQLIEYNRLIQMPKAPLGTPSYTRKQVRYDGRALESNVNSLDSRWKGGYSETWPLPDLVIYVDDLGIGGVKHTKENVSKLERNASVYYTEDSRHKEASKRKASALMAIGNIGSLYECSPVLLSSIIGFPIPTPAVSRKKSVEPDQVYTYNGEEHNSERRGVSQFLSHYSCTTLPASGYYLELNGHELKGINGGTHLPFFIREIEKAKGPVYMIRAKTVKKLDKTKVLDALDLMPFVQRRALSVFRRSIVLDAFNMVHREIGERGLQDARDLAKYDPILAALVKQVALEHRYGGSTWEIQSTYRKYDPAFTVSEVEYKVKERIAPLLIKLEDSVKAISTYMEDNYPCSSKGYGLDLGDVLKELEAQGVLICK